MSGYAGGRIEGPALGILAACRHRKAYPNALLVLSEPQVSFDGTVTALASREAQARAMPGPVAARWLWRQLPLAVWGVFTAAVVLVVLAIPVPVSAWLLVAGAGAAVAAVVIALPRRPPQPREPR